MQSFIFDFNGTLYQDSNIHILAWQTFLARRGISMTEQDFYRYMCGPPNDDILRRFVDPNLTAAQSEALSEEKEDIYRTYVRSHPELRALTPGAGEMLDMLSARGVPFAIATGSIRSNVDFYMDTLGIDRWFDYDRVFYAEAELPGKPDPAIYRLAMRKLGFRPEETTVVEDAMPGIQAAVGAGIERIIAIDTSLGAGAFSAIPQVRAVIHDFYGFERFLTA